MRLTQEHYDRIAHCFPKHRGSLTYSNLEVLNAILYIAENGAKWRRLPKEYGHWHTVYARMRGWARQGVLARVFEAMQAMQIIAIKVEVCSLDSTSVKVHPDGTGALKKGSFSVLQNGSDGRGRGGGSAVTHPGSSAEVWNANQQPQGFDELSRVCHREDRLHRG
jgi:transposase